MNIRSLLIPLSAGLFAILLGDQFGAAKTIQEETRRTNNGSSSGLALEISFDTKNEVFQVFKEVPAAGATSHTAAFLRTVSTYKGRDPQLDFWYAVEGEAVRVTIGLSYPGSGAKFKTGESEQNVRQLLQTNAQPHVSYLLQPDQKTDVNDFSEYGVKPFKMVILRIKQQDPPLPSFSSCTDAIQLVSVKRLEGEFPSYRFTVRNAGSRRIDHLRGETDTRRGLILGDVGPVAEAGKQFTLEVLAGDVGRVTGDAYRPDTFASFKVTGVVFEDGDFAGDRKYALTTLNRAICDRLTLELFVGLLNERIESGATDLGELRSKVFSVSRDVGVDEMRQLNARFPELSHPLEKVSCAAASDFRATGLLGRIDTFERDQSQSTAKGTTIDFLKSWRDSYLQWLSQRKTRTSDQPPR